MPPPPYTRNQTTPAGVPRFDWILGPEGNRYIEVHSQETFCRWPGCTRTSFFANRAALINHVTQQHNATVYRLPTHPGAPTTVSIHINCLLN